MSHIENHIQSNLQNILDATTSTIGNNRAQLLHDIYFVPLNGSFPSLRKENELWEFERSHGKVTS